jgi:hypothetical protein
LLQPWLGFVFQHGMCHLPAFKKKIGLNLKKDLKFVLVFNQYFGALNA